MWNTLFLSAVILFSSVCLAGETAAKNPPPQRPPRRISSKIVDLGKVQPVYIVAGMATSIEVPGPVTGIRTGNPDDLQYFRPEKPENEVTLILKNSRAKPTNLIIRSGKRKYVFDIIPSKQIHQDTVEVVAAYGGPELEDSQAVLLDSSDPKPAVSTPKGGVQ